MKTIQIFIVASVFMLLGVNASFAQNKKNSKEDQVKYNVNLHCHSCEQKIKKNIAFEKGVKDLSVDLKNNTVTVDYRTDKTNKDNIKKAIEKLGYTAEEVDAPELKAAPVSGEGKCGTPAQCSKSTECIKTSCTK